MKESSAGSTVVTSDSGSVVDNPVETSLKQVRSRQRVLRGSQVTGAYKLVIANTVADISKAIEFNGNQRSSSISISNSNTNSNYKFSFDLGCWKDNKPHALPHGLVGDKNPPEHCQERCRQSGYTYAGFM